MIEAKKLIVESIPKRPRLNKLFVKKGDELIKYEEPTHKDNKTANSNVSPRDPNDRRWEFLKSQIYV